ncbi:uncharacterized protein DNG_03617 [Cephalotrichum gorgonifer]|uniref:Uncharacterized protein n=1 Tax=Cephalotrichum gorgonifer TaxID=2041049 RepID=A0AAE8STT4_9PEZI|nr:uncharacterized protein DNG_03617 [Cephalotrichum gorgonifer]
MTSSERSMMIASACVGRSGRAGSAQTRLVEAETGAAGGDKSFVPRTTTPESGIEP